MEQLNGKSTTDTQRKEIPQRGPPAISRKSQLKKGLQSSNKMELYARISHVIWISLFAYLGVLVRVTTTYLSGLPKETLLPKLGASFFLPNMLGSFLVGTLGPLKNLFKPWPAIHVGLATGFCGSCTTFATWQLVAAAQILNGAALDSVIQSLVTFCTSYMCLLAGKHLGEKINVCALWYIHPERHSAGYQESSGIPLETKENGVACKETETRPRCASLHVPQYVPSSKSFLSLVGLFVLTSVSVWILIFTDPALYRTQWWVAVAFGPIGAVIRYLLSLKNPSFPNFPLFTFIANITGTVLNILILMLDNYFEGYDLVSAEGPLTPPMAQSTFKFWVRYGVSTGLMGSLSTVSTWVNEIWVLAKAKKTWFAYRYALCSLVVAQLLCLLIGGIWMIAGNQLLL